MNQENILRQLLETMKKHPKGTCYESTNSKYHYEVASFRRLMNDKSSMNVDEAFEQLFDSVGTESSELVNSMIRHLVTNHKEETIDALHELKQKTIMDVIVDGMKDIASGTVIFEHDGSVRLVATPGDDDIKAKRTIRPKCFLTGDLKFLAIMLGKQNFETWWCCWCKMFKDDWQDNKPQLKDDDIWTLESLSQQSSENKTKKHTGKNRMGVTEKGPFLEGDVEVVFPALHAMMGVVNDLMDYFFDKVDADIEPIPREEMELRDSIPANKALLQTQEQDFNVWVNATNGGLKLVELKGTIKTLEREMKQLNADSDEYKSKASDKKDAEECQTSLLCVRKQFEDEIERLKKAIKDAPAKILTLRKARKVSASSLYNKCEKIFKQHNVDRGSYHGGNFNGVNIIRLMLDATEIMDEIAQLFQDEGRADSKEKAATLCNDTKHLLQAWDKIFAGIHEPNPSNEFCDNLQSEIDVVMKKWRALNLSVTPKGHGVEHVVTGQMKRFPGGIAPYLEYWVEHAHQTGGKKDYQWKSMQLAKQGELGAKRDVASRLSGTIEATKKVTAMFVGVRKRKRKASSIAADNVKKERREESVTNLRSEQLGDTFTMADIAAVIDGNG